MNGWPRDICRYIHGDLLGAVLGGRSSPAPGSSM